MRSKLSPILAGLAVLALAGCGGSSSKHASTPTSTAAAAGGAQQSNVLRQPISANTKRQPTILKPSGTPPSALYKRDVVVGTGPAAKAGDTLTVDYVGASYSTGQVFDASWSHPPPLSFPLGQGSVIPGWDQGLVGMKVGGRRELVIPPQLGYGAQGTQGIAPNETLIFVVDLRKLG